MTRKSSANEVWWGVFRIGGVMVEGVTRECEEKLTRAGVNI